MTIAPAIAVACLRALGLLCLIAAVLALAVMAKEGLAPDHRFDRAAMAALAGGFAIGALACRWGADRVRRAIR